MSKGYKKYFKLNFRFFLQKSYSFEDTQINTTIASEKDTTDANTSQSMFTTPKRKSRLSVSSTGRSPFMKSLSMNSSVSTDSTNDIFSNPDKRFCISAMEHIMTLLGSQSLLALKDTNLSNREKQLIKRELSTELHTFHNFVKKRITYDQKGQLFRKHLGLEMIRLDDIDTSYYEINPRPIIHPDKSDSLRVRVTRKQHLDTAQMRTPTMKRQSFDLTRDIHPIGESTPKRADVSKPIAAPSSVVTPPATTSNQSSSSIRSTLKTSHSPSPCVKRVTFRNQERSKSQEEDITYYDPEEPTYLGLSIVKMSDKDYLHFLSNLFDLICQNV